MIAGGTSFYRRAPRVLIVEDELFIALLIEETVRLIGCRISAIADNISKANLELCKRNFDVVLLDLNIGGNYSTELADRVIKAKIPLAFITGYDYRVEPRHAHVHVLQKPFTPAQLNALLVQLLGPSTAIADRSTAHRDRFHLFQSPRYERKFAHQNERPLYPLKAGMLACQSRRLVPALGQVRFTPESRHGADIA